MSLFSALTAAVTGLQAQSQAIGNISDNLSNTSTVGYKRVDTTFESLVTDSNSNFNNPGGVSAKPVYQNSLQGDLQSSSSSTSLAIQGDGFFAVQRASTDATGTTTFSGTDYYTRKGDFTLNKDGYLVNGSGYYLLGNNVNETTGLVDTSKANPIQIAAVLSNPVATSNVDYAANLPAGATNGTAYPTSSLQVYDALGNSHKLDITWTKSAGNNEWQMNLKMDDSDIPLNQNLNFEFGGTTAGTISSEDATKTVDASTITSVAIDKTAKTMTLGSSDWATQGYKVGDTVTVAGSGAGTDAGSYVITSLSTDNKTATFSGATFANDLPANANVTLTRPAPGIAAGTGTGSPITIIPPVAPATTASISFAVAFGGGAAQTITMNLGDYNKSTGLTQFAATSLQTSSLEQNGIPRGSFQSLSISNDGLVSLNFDNGRSRTLFSIPIVTFNSPDNLQRVDGNAYARTIASGTPKAYQAGTQGAGTINGNSLEASNVDIADEFTTMIQSQRVYQANSKVITTTDSLLQTIIDVIR